jgi:hypothetical protein
MGGNGDQTIQNDMSLGSSCGGQYCFPDGNRLEFIFIIGNGNEVLFDPTPTAFDRDANHRDSSTSNVMVLLTTTLDMLKLNSKKWMLNKTWEKYISKISLQMRRWNYVRLV